MQTLTPATLIDDGRYMLATCGMHATLLAKVRAAVKDAAALQSLCTELADAATSFADCSSRVAIIVAPALGPPKCVVGEGDPLIAIWLMLDPLDIDSKQTTFTRGNEANTFMNKLYKWKGNAIPLTTHTALPTKIEEEVSERAEDSALETLLKIEKDAGRNTAIALETLFSIGRELQWCPVGPNESADGSNMQKYTPFSPGSITTRPDLLNALMTLDPTMDASKITGITARKYLLKALATLDPTMDRSLGAMVGLAVGDSVGAPLEFLPAVESGTGESKVRIADLHYDEPWNTFMLEQGQWTDDTSMSLCLADSLLVTGGKLDGSDLRQRFWSWWNEGYNNAFRYSPQQTHSVGLGGNISKSLYSMKIGEKPAPEYEATTNDAGNGSIMRLAPVAIAYHTAPLAEARSAAAASSRTTHPGPIASEACAFLSHLIIRALNDGFTKGPGAARAFLIKAADEYIEDVLSEREGGPGVDEMRRLLASNEPDGSKERVWNWRAPTLDIAGTLKARGNRYNGYPNSAGYFGSYAPDALAIALHAVANTDSFDAAIERCVNCLGDADSHGAVCGQIAGAMYGWTGIGEHLKATVRQWDDDEIGLRAALLVVQGRVNKK